MRTSPKSLVLDLLSSLKGGSMPVRALVEAGGLFGFEENSLRVALTRLVSTGLVEQSQRGEYRLGRTAAGVQQRVARWSKLDEELVAWDGAWLAVHSAKAGRSERGRLRKNTRALRLSGFRRLSRDLEIRPSNLAGGIARARRLLAELGLVGEASTFTMTDLDEDLERSVRELWDADAIRAGYRRWSARLERSERSVESMPLERAMVETFLVGGAAIRELVLDPLLPDAMVPARERRALVETMKRYDRLGRTFWAPWLGRHGVGRHATPTNSSGLYATEHRQISIGGTP